jgi:SAM-dependent methyltransferase
MTELYDSIGQQYRRLRRPDPTIRLALAHALDGLQRVVNVGAGTGSYEPRDRFVIAVEPSLVMIRQRSRRSAPVVRASATALPFRDGCFDASLGILTIHHWPDWRRGLEELARAARDRVVLLTWDPSAEGFWLVDDYFPEIMRINREIFPRIDAIRSVLGRISVQTVPIPHDCCDGFLGAYWRRPHCYLRPSVRGAISTFARLPTVDVGLERLRDDLRSGEWHRRHGHLLRQSSLDLGYRLVVAA